MFKEGVEPSASMLGADQLSLPWTWRAQKTFLPVDLGSLRQSQLPEACVFPVLRERGDTYLTPFREQCKRPDDAWKHGSGGWKPLLFWLGVSCPSSPSLYTPVPPITQCLDNPHNHGPKYLIWTIALQETASQSPCYTLREWAV